jgi:prepilin-type N-terminal cleavage/methylation domain-containing protein|tara:strand:- start:466 stop:987 length:522 start_codon:yes stop_codon:yes gene_type:complete
VRPAITLIELLIVIALVGIIAGTGWPTLTGWNCKQELRNEFESLNNVFEKARVEAINRNKMILVQPNKSLPTNGATYSVYLLDNKICSATQGRQSLSNIIPNLTISDKYKLLGAAFQCFDADGSATASQATQVHQIQRTCSGQTHSYQTLVFGATGLFEKKVFFAGTTGFLDL